MKDFLGVAGIIAAIAGAAIITVYLFVVFVLVLDNANSLRAQCEYNNSSERDGRNGNRFIADPWSWGAKGTCRIKPDWNAQKKDRIR